MGSLPILAWSVVEGDVGVEHTRRFGNRFRRIGRYVRLAQVAAARCVEACPGLDLSRAGLFLGTGLGNTADMVPLAEGVLHASRPRSSPMAFAGSLGNAAGFFTAQALGCLGPNVTLSQEELSFEVALLEASLALAAGTVELALVGGVDVISGSDEEQRNRVNAAGVPGRIAEGAAFLLLAAGGEGRAQLAEVWVGRAPEADVLGALPHEALVLLGWRLGRIEVSAPRRAPVEPRLIPVASALALVEALEAGERQLVHLQRNAAGTWGRVRVGA